MPAGPVKIENFKVTPPSRTSLKNSMEALINHFKLYSQGFEVPFGETFLSIESAKGELGAYLIADNTTKPYRVGIRSPGFAHLQGLNLISQELLIADLVTNIGSGDFVFGEIDR